MPADYTKATNKTYTCVCFNGLLYHIHNKVRRKTKQKINKNKPPSLALNEMTECGL